MVPMFALTMACFPKCRLAASNCRLAAVRKSPPPSRRTAARTLTLRAAALFPLPAREGGARAAQRRGRVRLVAAGRRECCPIPLDEADRSRVGKRYLWVGLFA